MSYRLPRHSVLVLLALCLLTASCGAVAPGHREPDAVPSAVSDASPLVQPFPLPSAVSGPMSSMPTPMASQLLVLHTNDNWGETEPCG